MLPGNGTFNGTYNELNAIANSVLRHSYAFSLPTVSLFHTNAYSFHHGGKNKCLLQFFLTVAVKRGKSGEAAA